MERTRNPVQLIGTPIGNLGDISFRAVECLRHADIIACEDTRHSARLLSHLEIRDKQLSSLHDHNEEQKARSLIEHVLAGERLVFLSDAGMPTISDPGYRLVNVCIENDIEIEVIPGPCAVTTALAGSGMPTDAFYFGGFLPVKSGKRKTELEAALSRKETSIFFESPYRIQKTLDALTELAPDREICVARELTKKFETYHRGTAKGLSVEFAGKKAKGEISLLVRGSGRKKRDPKGLMKTKEAGP